MKLQSRILYRLILYFSVVLLLFSIALTLLFIVLFKTQAVDATKEEMETHAITISAKLTEYLNNSSNMQEGAGPSSQRMQGAGQGTGQGTGQGYKSYLRLLDEITMTDVWIVDQNLNLLTIGNPNSPTYNYSDLPEDAEEVVNRAFQGDTIFSENFSPLMSTSTLTVGTPIYQNGKTIGVLLLHSPVKGIDHAVTQGVKVLAVSASFSFLLAILASILLAFSFTKPLQQITETTRAIGTGRYDSKTNVYSKDEIGELANAIDDISNRLACAEIEREHLSQMRHDFISNVSHELRTPVTVLSGSLEALIDGIVHDPIQVKNYYLQMLKESKYLHRLIEDLLDLSRLQNMNFSMQFSEFSLKDLLDDVIRSAQQIADIKSVTIQLNGTPRPSVLNGDYVRVRQMFLILLDNAIKFSPPASSIQLIATEGSLSVVDHGVGIPAEDLPYVFDRFFSSKSEQNKEGTGLGLSIAKQIAQRHGYALTVKSTQQEGTVFTIAF